MGHSSFCFSYKHDMFYQTNMSIRTGNKNNAEITKVFKCVQRLKFQLYFGIELVKSTVKQFGLEGQWFEP